MPLLLRDCLFVGLVVFSVAATAADRPIFDVWPGKAPGETKDIGPEELLPAKPKQRADVQRLTNVSRPTLTLYQPAAGQRNGAAVIICPGGGYSILAWDLEGTEVAQWLNSIGVTAAVLKYRVPRRDGDAADAIPLGDGQRAISLLRSKASDLGIDPRRIGILGFSAGGNLAARACFESEQRAYAKQDAIDDVSCRPDFGVLIYPAYLADNGGQLRPEYQPAKQTPPLFFAFAADDRVTVAGSLALAKAMVAAGAPAELHMYGSGGHGFGLRKSDDPCHTWPARCEEWLKRRGLVKK